MTTSPLPSRCCCSLHPAAAHAGILFSEGPSGRGGEQSALSDASYAEPAQVGSRVLATRDHGRQACRTPRSVASRPAFTDASKQYAVDCCCTVSISTERGSLSPARRTQHGLKIPIDLGAVAIALLSAVASTASTDKSSAFGFRYSSDTGGVSANDKALDGQDDRSYCRDKLPHFRCYEKKRAVRDATARLHRALP